MIVRSASRPFRAIASAWLTGSLFVMVAASLPARAENSQQATLSGTVLSATAQIDNIKADKLRADNLKSDAARVATTRPGAAVAGASVQAGADPAGAPAANQTSPANQSQQDNPTPQKGITEKTIDKVKQVVK